MKETFFYTLRAILPILLVILLGYVCRWIFSFQDEFYRALNRLCFYLFLPIHLFCNIYSIDSLADMNWRAIGYLFFAVFLCFGIGFLASRLLIKKRNQRGVIIQVAMRPNQAILGLPLANALGGEAAMAFASMATSVCVPVFNVLAVIVLTVYGEKPGQKITARALVRRVITNPLIIGCLSGLAAVLVRQLIPTADGVPLFTIQNQLPSIYQTLRNLSGVASPMMLFVLGSRLDLSSVPGLLPQLRLGVLLRLVICPATVLSLGLLLREPLGLTALEIPTLISISATPVAVSSALMTQELGGDDQLASQLVVWTSVLSVFSVFCIIYLMRSLGFL